MGSVNLRDSTSFAKDDVPIEENVSDANITEEKGESKAAFIKRIVVDMFRSYWISGVKTIERITGRCYLAESKRRQMLSVTRNTDFEYRIKRTVSVKDTVKAIVNEIENTLVMDQPEIADNEVTEKEVPEVRSDVPITETVPMISAPQEMMLLTESASTADEIVDELVDEYESQVIQNGVVSNVGMSDIGTEDSPMDVVVRTEPVSAATSSIAMTAMAVDPFPFDNEVKDDGVDFEDLYDELMADFIVDDLLPELVPEDFDPNYASPIDNTDYQDLYDELMADFIVNDLLPKLVPEDFDPNYVAPVAPEYVISEIAEPVAQETIIEVPQKIDDGVDYNELYEDLAAFIIMSDVMPEIVPEVFDESYGKEVAVEPPFQIIKSIDLPVVEETIITDVPYVPRAKAEDTTDYQDLYDELMAEFIVNELLPRLVPEDFDPNYVAPEYVISEIAEPVMEETTIEVPEEIDDGIDFEEFYEDFVVYEIVEEIMPWLVPEVFDPNYGKVAPEYVISEIAEPVTQETTIELPEPAPQIDYEDLYDELMAEFIVNNLLPKLVPEDFDPNYVAPVAPEYIISEIAVPVAQETTIEMPIKTVPEYVISEISEPVVDFTTIDVPPTVAIEETAEESVPISTVTTFRFAFASTASPGRTGFSFTFGKPVKNVEDVQDYDDTPVSKMEQNDGTVFASPVVGGMYQ